MAKRSYNEAFEEFESLASINHTSPRAKIHCVVTRIPDKMKEGKNSTFFDGDLRDDSSSIRVYGYDKDVRRKLFDCQKEGETILLSGCSVKKARNSKDLEVFVSNSTTIEKSKKAFTVPCDISEDTIVSIDKLDDISTSKKITVEVKVICMDEPSIVPSSGKRIQELTVADATAQVRLTIWEKEIGTMKINQSYHLSNVTIREFHGKKSLSTSKYHTTINTIEDIGDVYKDNPENPQTNEDFQHLKNVKIIGVQNFSTYDACFKCGGKLNIDKDDEEMGECVRCTMVQCISECRKSAMVSLTLKTDVGQTMMLRAFDKVLLDIAETPDIDNITPKVLLKAKPFGIHFQDGIIRSISHS